MGLEKTMMKRWMGRKKPEAIAAMMNEVMPMMMEKMGPAGMAKMMPAIMEPSEMVDMMHEAKPKMTEHCFSTMDDAQRRDVLAMCRGALDEMEEKFLEPSPATG